MKAKFLLSNLNSIEHKFYLFKLITRGCFLFLFLFAITVNSTAQRTCGTDERQEELMNDPAYRSWFEKNRERIRKKVKEGMSKSMTTITIPVAVHFGGNINNSDMCCLINACLAQVDVMNEDFSSTNADIFAYNNISSACPVAFPPEALSNGTNLQFAMATSNHPSGSGLSDGEYAITIGEESFPSAGGDWSGYLNIFVDDTFGFLGEASSISGGSNPDGDGFIVRADAFGGPGFSCSSGAGINTNGTYNLGRTATHEAGHYFGLEHIFSGCSNGDDIDDTPNQTDENYGTPSFNFSTCSSDANNSCSTEDFFMNYMDYVDDVSMIMFTADQGDVMDETADHDDWNTDVFGAAICDTYTSPNLSAYVLNNSCPDIMVDLNSIQSLGTPPCNTQFIWSQDGDPSNGIWGHVDPIVTFSGTYYGYYFNPVEGCYSPASDPVIVTISSCCQFTNTIVIDSDVTYDTPMSMGGDITILAGGKLTITSALEMGQYKEIRVNDGGELVLEGEQAILRVCSDVTLWQGVSVFNGGKFTVNRGYIYKAKDGIRAYEGSTLDLKELVVWGPNNGGESGIYLKDKVSLIRAENIVIFNYFYGVYAQDGNSYYNFDVGHMSNVNNGFRLRESPSRINGFHITAKADGIGLWGSPACLVENNTIFPSQDANLPAATTGIRVEFSHATVIRANTIGDTDNPAFNGINMTFSNSSLITDQNKITSKHQGIYAAYSNVTINANDINCKYYGRGGIFIYASYDNQIKSNYIDAIGSEYGIETVSCHDSEIENNEILGVVVTGNLRVAAIRSIACTGQRIAYNDISGIGGTTGILAQNTTGNVYECNNVENGEEGLGIYFNSAGHTIRGNTFNASTDLGIRSITGLQVHEGNEFLGGKADASALSSADVFDSRFFVNPNVPNHLPTNINPASGWFIEEPNDYSYYICSGSPGPNWTPFWDEEDILCAHYHEVLNEYGYGSKEYLRMMLTIKRHAAYNEDYFIYECIGDPVPPECIDILVGVEKQLMEYFGGAENQAANQLLGNVNTLSELIQENPETEFIQTLAGYANNASALFNQNNQQYQNGLDGLEEELQQIDCNDKIIKIGKVVLLNYINFLKAESDGSYNHDKIVKISKLCSDEYGPYVNLARNLAANQSSEYFDNYDGCGQPQTEQNSAKITTLSGEIYPNPSTGFVYLNFNETVNGQLTVSSVDGKILQERRLDETRNLELNLSDYQGLNIVKVLQDNGEFRIFKVLIID